MNGMDGRMCTKNEGLRTVKRKHDIPEDVRGQPGREGVGQEEVVTRAARNTDTDVRSTAREHREQGRNEERVMWSHEGRKMSMYSKVNIDAQEEPSEGKCEMKRDSTPRCLGRWMVEPKAEHASHARGGIQRAIKVTGNLFEGQAWRMKEE